MAGGCTGTVTSYDRREGNGFITSDNVFVHYQSIVDAICSLKAGDYVKFDMETVNGRMEAINVKLQGRGGSGVFAGPYGDGGGGIYGIVAGGGHGGGGGVGVAGGGDGGGVGDDCVFYDTLSYRMYLSKQVKGIKVEGSIKPKGVATAWKQECKTCVILNCDASVHADKVADPYYPYDHDSSHGDFTVGSILRSNRGHFYQCHAYKSNGLTKLTSTEAEANAVYIALERVVRDVAPSHYKNKGVPLLIIVRTDCSSVIAWLQCQKHKSGSFEEKFVAKILHLVQNQCVDVEFQHESSNANMAADHMTKWAWELLPDSGVKYGLLELTRSKSKILSIDVLDTIRNDIIGVPHMRAK